MKSGLAWALLAVMTAVVAGQELHLRGLQPEPVTQIRLHESRLVAFLQEIRGSDPDTYDSILLNLQRLKDGPALGQDLQPEEIVVAEELLARLNGHATPAAPAAPTTPDAVASGAASGAVARGAAAGRATSQPSGR